MTLNFWENLLGVVDLVRYNDYIRDIRLDKNGPKKYIVGGMTYGYK